MIDKIKELLAKHTEEVNYIITGFSTTGINYAVYALMYYVIKLPNVPSTVIAWICSVTFAFFTYKLFVFKSKSMEARTVLKEAAGFVGGRLGSGAVDVGIMYLGVDLLHLFPMFVKVCSTAVTMVINYLVSKFLIFKKKD